MKKFVVADVQELNINETANGFFCCDYEICIFTHDDGKNKSDSTDDNTNKLS